MVWIWNINTIVPIITFFLYGGLFAVVALAKPQTQSRRRFRWYMFSMALWSLSAFFLLIDTDHSLFWLRFLASSAITTMISLFYFVQTFIELKPRWMQIVAYYGAAAILISMLSNLVVRSANIQASTVVYDFGPMMAFVAGPSYILILFSLFILIRSYTSSDNVIQRNRLLYLMIGIALTIMTSVVNFTEAGKYPVDIAANGVSALLIGYAILRYQLLDIRVVVRQGLFYSIPTVIIGAAYFLIITLSLRLFNLYSGLEIFLLSLVVAVISALVAEPLRERAQSIIDRMFFREKYDSRLMLQNLSSRVATVLNLYEITHIILEEVTSTLHIPRAAFFLKDEESGRFQLINQIGLEHLDTVEFRRGHPAVLWLNTHQGSLTNHDIEVLPQFQSLWKSERDDLEKIQAELFIPVKVQSELVGIFVIGTKRSEQAYDEDDRLTLTTLANQTAVAIENARLYTAEQNRRKEMDTLYNMARELVATDDLDTVLRSVAAHAVESINVTYARILTKEENGGFLCRAVHPAHNLTHELGLGQTEKLVSEHYYNWILQRGQTMILHRDDPDLKNEEREAIFFNNANTLCLCPMVGVDEYIGLLIFGEVRSRNRESFTPSKQRLINVIADHATNAIQRALLHQQLEENFLQTVVSLANAMDARDSYTGDHSHRMADLTTRISSALDLTERQIESIHWASILHDIGKIGVPDEILNKPGPLTEKEWVVMRQHPVIGSQIVAPIKMLAPVSPIIRAHHERYDGSGYPFGLKGDEIPIESRILSVVDAYIAIRDQRVYSKSHTHEEAIAELRRNSGTQFDPHVIDVFCRVFSEPVDL